CKNNLKQLGLALHNYHDTNNCLPPSYLILPGGGGAMGPPDPFTADAGPGWGWLTLLLPQMEQGNLYNAFNINIPCWDTRNAAPAKTTVASYVCPSAANPTSTYSVVDASGQPLATLARANYVVSAGRRDVWNLPNPDLSALA